MLLAAVGIDGGGVKHPLGVLEVICPLQSGPSTILVWTLKEKENGQETRA